MNYFIFFLIISHFSSSVWVLAASVCDRVILTPYVKAGNVSAARVLSEVDSSNLLNVKSYSGYLTVEEEYNSNLFYWFFPHERIEEVPLIIWLQGGPGWSSLVGLFDLIGPIQIKDANVAYRNVTWASNYSLLFVDNPVGAGFSFTDDERGYLDNEDDVGEQLYEFLLQFLKMFPELRGAPLFIGGESYAGKYVPALAIQIHRNQDKLDEPINFKGISIGNGLIDPRSMMHYSELCGVLGIVEGKDLDTLKQLEENAVALLYEERMVDAANKFNETIEFIKKQSGVNIYNFNEDPSHSASTFEAFVTKPDIRCLIHAGNGPYYMNNQLVYSKMLPDFMNTTKPFVEELLEHYGVLLYTGQLDVIIPYGMSRRLYKELSWSQRQSYDEASRIRLRNSQNNAVAGYKKSGGNLVEVLIRRSGHMVPKDQPEVLKCVVDDFINKFK